MPDSKEMSRRDLLKLIGVGAVSVGIAAGVEAARPLTAFGKASEQATASTETAQEKEQYQAELAKAVAEKIEEAKKDTRPIFEEKSPVTYADLLAPIKQWNEIQEFIIYFADTYMIKRNGDSPKPIDQIANEMKNWGSEFTLRLALPVSAINTDWDSQLGMSTSAETGKTGQDWEEHISPFRRFVLFILDMQTGAQAHIENDSVPDSDKTFKDTIFEVYVYLLTKVQPDLLVGYIRDIEPNKDAGNPTVGPKFKINETQYFDASGFINYINEEVFIKDAAEKFSGPTKEHSSLAGRMYDAFLGKIGVREKEVSGKRKRTADQVKNDLAHLRAH